MLDVNEEIPLIHVDARPNPAIVKAARWYCLAAAKEAEANVHARRCEELRRKARACKRRAARYYRHRIDITA